MWTCCAKNNTKLTFSGLGSARWGVTSAGQVRTPESAREGVAVAGERFGKAVGDQAGQCPLSLRRVRPGRVQPGRRYRLIGVAEHGEQASPAPPAGALVTLAAARPASFGIGAACLVPGARGDHQAVGAAGPVSGAH